MAAPAQTGKHPEAKTAEAIMAEAQAATGLSDFGPDDSFRVGLEVLMRSVGESRSAAVQADAYGRIRGLLIARLRLTEDEQRHPEVRGLAIERPMVVMGLPRTGTTITVDLLSRDADVRYPREWEVMAPWPATQAATIDSDPRIAAIQPLVDQFLLRAPELAAVHRFDCTAPAECNGMMMYHFSSTNYYAELGTRAFNEWLIASPPDGFYRDHRRLLQQMQWKGPKGRWLVKSPQHLFNLPGLFETYPDARIVWTHRDPVTTFSSLSSMIVLVQKVAGLKADPLEVGDVVMRTWTRALLNAVQARAADPEVDAAIVDLPHKAVTRDPIDAMRRVYAFFEQPFSDGLAERMRHFLAEDDKASRAGRHRHRPEDFGIDPDTVRRALAPYYERYGALIA
jgi:hypothetical protein